MIEKKYLNLLACPLCHGSLLLKSNYLFCSTCEGKYKIIDGIPVILPQSLGEDLQLTQDKWNEEYSNADTVVDIATQPYLRDSFKHLLKFLPKQKGFFLELGCGTAKNSFLLKKETQMDVVGVDISLKALQAAKKVFKNGKKEGFFVCGDIRNLPFKSDVFDYMYGPGTIEHFEDTSSAIKDLYRCLKKGGVLTATVPFISLSTPYWMFYGNIPDIWGIKHITTFIHSKIFKGKLQPFGYEKSFTEGKLRSLFKKRGFRNIKFGLLDTYYQIKITDNEFLKNILRRVARSRIFWPFVYINGKK
jgi:ubiquinone/menaquinone biosynthesis C-methylase UbiE